MKHLVKTKHFERAFRKYVRGDRKRLILIEDTLLLMSENIFATRLGTHKLSGKLQGAYACSCGYDCRIVFYLDTFEHVSHRFG